MPNGYKNRVMNKQRSKKICHDWESKIKNIEDLSSYFAFKKLKAASRWLSFESNRADFVGVCIALGEIFFEG